MGNTGILQFLPHLLASAGNLDMLLEVLERAPVAVAVSRGADHRLVLANSAYRAFFDAEPGAKLAATDGPALPPGIAAEGAAILGEVHDRAEVRRLHEVAMPRAGQPLAFYDVEFQPLRDAQGKVEAVLIVAVDVTDKLLARQRIEQAEAALREKEEEFVREREARFRELADAMPQIVWSAGPDGHVDYYNRRSLDYTRSPDGAGVDRGWRESMHPDDVQHTIERWRHSVRTGESYEIEYRFKEPDSGQYRWHLGRALPVRNDAGEIVRWLGTSTDIDDQKLVEQELADALSEKEKLLELKTSLLREINHRVKNSLQLVSSLLNLQGRNINDPEVRFRFDEATRRVLTVARVHERLYETDNIDRMEFGQFLRELCQDIGKSLMGHARGHSLTIEAPRYDVLVDQAIPLALVVNELVTNAFKYAFDDTRTGEVRVTLGIAESEIQLAVADNGRGMPPGFDAAKSRGLGMILVNALTRQLKGRLEFRAGAPGATFILTAPRIVDAAPGLRITSARVPSPSDGLRA